MFGWVFFVLQDEILNSFHPSNLPRLRFVSWFINTTDWYTDERQKHYVLIMGGYCESMWRNIFWINEFNSCKAIRVQTSPPPPPPVTHTRASSLAWKIKTKSLYRNTRHLNGSVQTSPAAVGPPVIIHSHPSHRKKLLKTWNELKSLESCKINI